MSEPEIIDCPALHVRHIDKGYPFGDKVPKTIRLLMDVSTDQIPGTAIFISRDPLFADEGKNYPAWTNSYGAVCACFPNGKKLGVKPDEFEVVEWHPPVSIVHDLRKTNQMSIKNDVEYLLGALRTVAGVAKERGISDLYAVAQAGLDLYLDRPTERSPEDSEIERLTAALAVEAHLKEEWIAEYVKLRDGAQGAPNERAH